jgi:hypothetical protein
MFCRTCPTKRVLNAFRQGIKVFVNICYDSHVPAPPQGSEDIIQHAMRGGELPGMDVQGSEWFVPVVVSHPREDSDKCTHRSLSLHI